MYIKPKAGSQRLKLIQTLAKVVLPIVFAMGATTQVVHSKNNPPPRIKADAPNTYIVKSGDTLWSISNRYLQHPWRWKEIWATNRQIANPHRIWPGDKLILCLIQGKRVVGIDSGTGCSGLIKGSKVASAPRQSNTGGSIRYEKLSSAIPTLPLSVIRPWLYNAQVVDPVLLKQTPYVIASKNKNIITAVGDTIYVTGTPLEVGEKYGVYKVGKGYRSPSTGRSLGQEVYQVATGVVTDLKSNGVSTLELKETFRQEVNEGDKVFISLDNTLPPLFTPKAGSTLRNARIIRVHGSLGTAAKNSVVVVNIGQVHGAEPGQVFAIYKKGALIRDDNVNGKAVRMPSERSGMVMIFKTFDQVSYGFVLESDNLLKIGDELKSPEDFDE